MGRFAQPVIVPTEACPTTEDKQSVWLDSCPKGTIEVSNEMTVAQAAKRLKLNPRSAYHRLQKYEEYGVSYFVQQL